MDELATAMGLPSQTEKNPLLTPEEAADRLAAETSLYEFVKQAWSVVEPDVDFLPGWHIEAICLHLEAVAAGKVANLLINVPPGTSKSLTCCVFWPAWVWINEPGVRFLCATYEQRLSTRDSQRCRLLIQSPWYRRFWHDWRLTGDQNEKTKYENDKRGWRIATSVGGRGTGEHPDVILCDDPIKQQDANSEVERAAVIDWWDGTMSSRGQIRGSRRVVIMQRLHEDDLSGHIMADLEGWDHLCLPMRYEPDRMAVTSLGWDDPRQDEGDLLWPDAFTEEKVSALEKGMGSLRAAGQLQQRPHTLGGNMFKRSWFECVPASPALARRVRYWDKAGTKDGGAYSAGLMMSEYRGIYYIENVRRAQMDPFERNRMIKQTAAEDQAAHPANMTQILEQEPGSGGKESSLISVRELAGYHVVIDRVHTGKEERAYAFASQCGAGNVKIVGEIGDKWVRELLDELESFPNGKYKDQVDCATGAFNKLALGGGVMRDIDLFSDDDDRPLTEDEMEDLPPALKDIIDGEDGRVGEERTTYDPRSLAE